MKVRAVMSLLLAVASMAGAQTNRFGQAWQEYQEQARPRGTNEQAAAATFSKLAETSGGQGLARSAILELQAIEKQAVEKREWPDAVRAVFERVRIESDLRGGHVEELIPEIRERLRTAPEPMRPFMELVLAHLYWRYLMDNRWEIDQRTQVEGAAEGEDVRAWSLPRLLAETERQFERALAYESVLKQLPVDSYGSLLQTGSAPDAYRPTLYDFIAYAMLDFYALGELNGLDWGERLPLLADGPALDDVSDFCFLIPDEAAQRSHILRALRLFQKLLEFHRGDEDPSAFGDADLGRLQFCYNVVEGKTRDERYAVALDRFMHRWRAHEISSRAFALRATLAWRNGETGVARMLAEQGSAAFPKSVGAAQCRNLIARIEEPAVSFEVERVWNEPWPEMEITYKNLTEVHFRAIQVGFDEAVASADGWLRPISEVKAETLLRRKPVKSWTVALPPAPNHSGRTHRVRVPDKLAPGLYAVFASADKRFVKKSVPVSSALIRVSKLALVVERDGARNLGGYVVSAQSGEPVDQARVQIWRSVRGGRYKREYSVMTGPDGYFLVTGDQAGDYLFEAQKDGQAAHTWERQWRSNERERYEEPEARVVFFTDRNLYRPGQTLHFKGIAMVLDGQSRRYYALGGKRMTVRFEDQNEKLISELEVSGNDYGSFSGCFTVPRDRGTGRMGLKVGSQQTRWIQVEEYKRPQYGVSLSPAEPDARLGALATVCGEARAFSGVPVVGAKVAWRVERACRLPFGCLEQSRFSGDMELVKGVTETDEEGRFSISFFAKPDAAVKEKDVPEYGFRISADVTDCTGETRSCEQRVLLGCSMWRARVYADGWLTTERPTEVRVGLVSFAEQGVAAEGDLKIFKVMQPMQVIRPPLDFVEPEGRPPEDKNGGDPANWPDDHAVFSEKVVTDTNGVAAVLAPLKAGLYRARYEARDPEGKSVTAWSLFRVIDPDAQQLNIREPFYFCIEAMRVEPGGTFRFVWGSGYEKASALLVVEQAGRTLMRVRTKPGVTQQVIELPVTEEMRGAAAVHVFCVRDNRMHAARCGLEIPWINKRLDLQLERFSPNLEPGKKEAWRAVVRGPQGAACEAEVVAVLYDRSLDALGGKSEWPRSFEALFNTSSRSLMYAFENRPARFDQVFGSWLRRVEEDSWTYRAWPSWMGDSIGRHESGVGQPSYPSASAEPGGFAEDPYGRLDERSLLARANGKAGSSSAGAADGFVPRRDLRETAFFLPHVASDAEGKVALDFEMPETLTGWRLMAFAHDKELRSGFLEAEAVSVKKLMVETQPPRFVREGDEMAFAVKVSNRSEKRQGGRVRLGFFDAATRRSVDEGLGNVRPDQDFVLEAGESRALEWRIRIGEAKGYLTYKAIAVSDDDVDGEEGSLPVLPTRVAVRESQSFQVKGPEAKTFSFMRLRDSEGSRTLRHQSLTVQVVSQPAWYAVLALPYLMEFPHACCEQTFNRYYAHLLGRHLINSAPGVRAVFDRWKNSDALSSPLERNEALKAVMIEETPWLREAEGGGAARRRVGVLFDDRRLAEESGAALGRLREARLPDGTWPWFPGGGRSDSITLYLVAGFGRLRRLGVAADVGMAREAVARLDAWVAERHMENKRKGLIPEAAPTQETALYLYARSFYLADVPVPEPCREAVTELVDRSKRSWSRAGRTSQARLALALKRWGETDTAVMILKSLREAATVEEGYGLYWRDLEGDLCAALEAQALMVEAFLEIGGDTASAEACNVWLLRQKQVGDWRTTKATADAVYALLLQGRSLLGTEVSADVVLGDKPVKPEHVEPGTGYYECRYGSDEVHPSMGKIKVSKRDEGLAWGALHWQYFEDMDRIKADESSPLAVRKQLFVKTYTAQGAVLSPVLGGVPQGAELVTRLEIRAERDVSYVHVKDGRASCAEPVLERSGFRWQGGLGYYESTRDTATHFFIESLKKGIHVLEYTCRAQQKGVFRTGMAEIQCLYAPELAGHSAISVIRVE